MHRMVNKTPTQIQEGSDTLKFFFSDGSTAEFYHEQGCCEDVHIEDVNGDWNDLLNTPLLVAEERNSQGEPEPAGWHESHTWTFYTFRSVYGSVDVRWLGSSNGYYSERVDFRWEGQS